MVPDISFINWLERLAHALERRTGVNNFHLARMFLVFGGATLLIKFLLQASGQPILDWVLLGTLFFSSLQSFRLETALQRLRRHGFCNPLKTDHVLFSVRALFAVFVVVEFISAFFGETVRNIFMMAVSFCCLAAFYAQTLDPLPPANKRAAVPPRAAVVADTA